MSKFAAIKTTQQIKSLCMENSTNVGVSPSGDLYVWDFDKNAHRKISEEEASELLKLPKDIISEVVKSSGHLELKPPVFSSPSDENTEEIQEDETEEVIQQDSLSCEEITKKPAEEVEKPLSDVKLLIKKVLDQVEELKKEIADFKEDIESGRKADKELHNELSKELQEFKQSIIVE